MVAEEAYKQDEDEQQQQQQQQATTTTRTRRGETTRESRIRELKITNTCHSTTSTSKNPTLREMNSRLVSLHPSSSCSCSCSKNRLVFLLFIIMFFLGVSCPANLFVDDVFGSFCSCHLHLLGSKERDRSF